MGYVAGPDEIANIAKGAGKHNCLRCYALPVQALAALQGDKTHLNGMVCSVKSGGLCCLNV